MPGGRVGVLVVMHHVVADGLRGVATIAALLDRSPNSNDSAAPRWRPEPPPTAIDLVTDDLRSRVRAIGRARPTEVPRRLRTLRAVSHEQAQHAPPTSLTGSIGPARRLLVLRQPLEELRARAHANGCTINDLLLAAVTAGLREMLIELGECPDGLVLRATVPVGARPGHPGGMIVAPLPVGTADPAQRLHRQLHRGGPPGAGHRGQCRVPDAADIGRALDRPPAGRSSARPVSTGRPPMTHRSARRRRGARHAPEFAFPRGARRADDPPS